MKKNCVVAIDFSCEIYRRNKKFFYNLKFIIENS